MERAGLFFSQNRAPDKSIPAAFDHDQGVFNKVNERGRGRLVPVEIRGTDKTRGRGRPRPVLERTLTEFDRLDKDGAAGPEPVAEIVSAVLESKKGTAPP